MSKLREKWHEKMKHRRTLWFSRNSVLLFVLMLIFGIVVTSHVQTVRAEFRRSDLEIRYRQRQEDLRRYEEEYERLTEENRILIQRQEDAIAELLQREGQEDILEGLRFNRMLAGFTEVSGQGVRITLDDKPDYDIFLDSEDSIVHDGDIRHVLDLLRNNGAAAFSVNQQRIVNTSYIYCIGPTILCNQQRLTPPYVIEALGDPEALAAAIQQDPVLAIRAVPGIELIVMVEQLDDVVIPAFAGANNLEPFINRLEVVR